jgi:hypothetical protein
MKTKTIYSNRFNGFFKLENFRRNLFCDNGKDFSVSQKDAYGRNGILVTGYFSVSKSWKERF